MHARTKHNYVDLYYVPVKRTTRIHKTYREILANVRMCVLRTYTYCYRYVSLHLQSYRHIPIYLPIYQPAYYHVRIEYVDSGLADYANKKTRTKHLIQPRT